MISYLSSMDYLSIAKGIAIIVLGSTVGGTATA